MTDDPKINFYLAHRVQIEEWSALRVQAADMLDKALLAAVHRVATEGKVPTPRLIEDRQQTYAKISVGADPSLGLAVEMGWTPKNLLASAGNWPSLRVVMDPVKGASARQVVRQATAFARETHGLTKTSTGWWVRWGDMAPAREPLDIGEYAVECAHRWCEAHIDLEPKIRAALESGTPSRST